MEVKVRKLELAGCFRRALHILLKVGLCQNFFALSLILQQVHDCKSGIIAQHRVHMRLERALGHVKASRKHHVLVEVALALSDLLPEDGHAATREHLAVKQRADAHDLLRLHCVGRISLVVETAGVHASAAAEVAAPRDEEHFDLQLAELAAAIADVSVDKWHEPGALQVEASEQICVPQVAWVRDAGIAGKSGLAEPLAQVRGRVVEAVLQEAAQSQE